MVAIREPGCRTECGSVCVAGQTATSGELRRIEASFTEKIMRPFFTPFYPTIV